MSTKVIVGIVAAVVVVGGGGWYVASKNAGGEAGMGSANEERQSVGTFAELRMRTGSWTCDVATMVENAESEGTVYVDSGKVRADFTSMVNGQAVVSHMIHADGYVYTWSDAYPQGMKMRIPEGEASAEGGSTGPIDNDAQVDYDCRPGGTSAANFTPPSDVSFMELGAEGGAGIVIPDMPVGAPAPY